MKMDMTAVADEHRARNQRVIKASRLHMPGINDDGDACEALALALLELAEMWREDARKAMNENRRGCKGTAESLRDCATRVSGVAIALRQHGLPVAETPESPKDDVAAAPPSPAGSESSISLDAPLSGTPDKPWEPGIVGPVTVTSGAPNGYLLDDPNPTQTFLAIVAHEKATELYMSTKLPAANAGPWTTVDAMASAVPATDTETLVEAASNIIAQVTEQRAADVIDPSQVKILKLASVANPDDVPVVVDLPSLVGPEGIRKAAESAGMTYPNPPKEMIRVQWQVGSADPAPAWALQPHVPVFELTDDPKTWQDSPDHASVSQVQLMGECGLKCWLRYRRGAPERPSWAMVGGSALHSCIEMIESTLAGSVDLPAPVSDLWKTSFEVSIMDTRTKNPLWPVETWHASKSGKEDRTWWDSDGPEMVHRYLAWRAHWIAQGWELIKDAQGPIIEREFLFFRPGKPVKGFIDSAWYHPQRQLVAILDWKSGASTPPDYFQPAIYAQALARIMGPWLAEKTVVGGYWDARKGELMAPGLVDLEERHPVAELVFRLDQFNAATSANIYMPNTNSAYGGCNSCSLKRSCPIGSRIGTGTINESVG